MLQHGFVISLRAELQRKALLPSSPLLRVYCKGVKIVSNLIRDFSSKLLHSVAFFWVSLQVVRLSTEWLFEWCCRLTVKNMERVTGVQEVKDPSPTSKDAVEGKDDSAYHSMHTSVYDQGLSWDFIPWLRSITKLPIFLKGILSPDDAHIAVHRYCTIHHLFIPPLTCSIMLILKEDSACYTLCLLDQDQLSFPWLD